MGDFFEWLGNIWSRDKRDKKDRPLVANKKVEDKKTKNKNKAK